VFYSVTCDILLMSLVTCLTKSLNTEMSTLSRASCQHFNIRTVNFSITLHIGGNTVVTSYFRSQSCVLCCRGILLTVLFVVLSFGRLI